MDRKSRFTKMSRCGSPEIRCPIRFTPRLGSMISTVGPVRATSAWTTRNQRATFLPMSRDTRTSMNTATGTKRQTMVQSGFRDMLELAGPLIVTDTGSGCLRGDGRGSKMSLGGMHRYTTGGGGPYGPHSAGNIHYANMHAPNGFTAVSRETLVRGQPVGRNALRVSPTQLSRMTPVHALDVRPTRTAVLGGGRAAVAPPSR